MKIFIHSDVRSKRTGILAIKSEKNRFNRCRDDKQNLLCTLTQTRYAWLCTRYAHFSTSYESSYVTCTQTRTLFPAASELDYVIYGNVEKVYDLQHVCYDVQKHSSRNRCKVSPFPLYLNVEFWYLRIFCPAIFR